MRERILDGICVCIIVVFVLPFVIIYRAVEGWLLDRWMREQIKARRL